MKQLSPSAQKVQRALDQFGLTLEVVELPGSTRTAVEAARAIGTTVSQIAKSLIFRAVDSGRAVLVIASGTNRVNEETIGTRLGERITKGDADFVRDRTGFVIGGVPPAGHDQPLVVFIDQDLLKFDEIWAAAGTPHAVFRLTPAALVKIAGGEVMAVI